MFRIFFNWIKSFFFKENKYDPNLRDLATASFLFDMEVELRYGKNKELAAKILELHGES